MRCVTCPSPVDAAQSDSAIDRGVAGASARREYERRQAKRDIDTRARWGDRLGGFVLAVTTEPQSTRAWAIGAAGEEKLARALEGVEGLQILHDRRVPGTKGNVDHILIAPAGVFVVDAKQYEGRIEIRNRGWFLRPDYRLYVGGRDRSALADGLGWQVEAVVRVLGASGVDPLLITPVLCFIDGDWPLIGRPTSYRGVRLEGTQSIRKLLVQSEDLDQSEITRLTRMLATALPPK
jgi:hypothetical protein